MHECRKGRSCCRAPLNDTADLAASHRLFNGLPVAQLTSALRSGCLSTSLVAHATQDRSPGVISAAFRAQSPSLRFAALMDMDFAVRCPLVRRSRLIPGSCPSTRTFALRFFWTPPRDGSPCVLLTLHLHQVGWKDLHLLTAEYAQHTAKPLCGGMKGDIGPTQHFDVHVEVSRRYQVRASLQQR